MIKKLHKIQLLATGFSLIILVVGLLLGGPVKQENPPFDKLPPTVLLAFITLFILVSIFQLFPIRYYDTYINKIVRREGLEMSDLAKLTQLDVGLFKMNSDDTLRTPVKYQKRVALVLEERFDLEK